MYEIKHFSSKKKYEVQNMKRQNAYFARFLTAHFHRVFSQRASMTPVTSYNSTTNPYRN